MDKACTAITYATGQTAIPVYKDMVVNKKEAPDVIVSVFAFCR